MLPNNIEMYPDTLIPNYLDELPNKNADDSEFNKLFQAVEKYIINKYNHSMYGYGISIDYHTNIIYINDIDWG